MRGNLAGEFYTTEGYFQSLIHTVKLREVWLSAEPFFDVLEVLTPGRHILVQLGSDLHLLLLGGLNQSHCLSTQAHTVSGTWGLVTILLGIAGGREGLITSEWQGTRECSSEWWGPGSMGYPLKKE